MSDLSIAGSLCAVSDLSVTSKATDEEVSQFVTFDHHGNVVSTVPSHLGQGQLPEHHNPFITLFLDSMPISVLAIQSML